MRKFEVDNQDILDRDILDRDILARQRRRDRIYQMLLQNASFVAFRCNYNPTLFEVAREYKQYYLHEKAEQTRQYNTLHAMYSRLCKYSAHKCSRHSDINSDDDVRPLANELNELQAVIHSINEAIMNVENVNIDANIKNGDD